MSASTNILITVVAARTVGLEDFGVFGVLYLLYLTVIGAVRALVGEPALVRVPHPDGWRRDVFASALALSMPAAVGLAAGATLLHANLAALVLAALLPAMAMQDVGRYVGFATRRPEDALRLDVTWGAAQVVALLALGWTGRLTLVSIVAAWAGAASLGGVQALWLNDRVLPMPTLRWIRASWEYSWRYLATFFMTAGIVQFTGLMLGAVSGATAVGAVRASQVLFGPLNVLFAGAIAVVVPEAARTDARSAGTRRRLVSISASLVVAAAAVMAIGLTLPDRAGRFVLGETWPAARELIVPVGLVALFGAVIAGADIGLRAARAVRGRLAVQLRLTPLQLLVPIGGAVLGDAAGYSWGLAAVTAVAAALWWRAFGRLGPSEADP
ncbi:MAG: hypothetical protein ACR2H3_06030 [Acidimicrobiales bacterium]